MNDEPKTDARIQAANVSLEKARILRSMVMEDQQVVELLDEILGDCLEGYEVS